MIKMQNGYFIFKIILITISGLFITNAHAYVIPEPPIFPNSQVSTNKECIWARIYTNDDNKPVLSIWSTCKEKYIYYRNGKKDVLMSNTSENWYWYDSERNKKQLTVSDGISDGNILNDFYDGISYKNKGYWNFNTKLINYYDETDFFTIKWSVSINENWTKQIHLDKIDKDCIKVEIKITTNNRIGNDLNITSTCKERYVYQSTYWPDKILLVNKEDYANRSDWWNKLITYLNDKYTFHASTVIWDDSIKEEKWEFVKKLVNFDNKNDVVLIKWEIKWKINEKINFIPILGIIIFVIFLLTVFYKKELLFKFINN